MSRIQDILAKAERDGTARRSTAVPSPSFSVVAPVAEPDPLVTPLRQEPLAAPRRRSEEPTLHPGLLAAIEPHSAVAEEFRAIRTRLAQGEERGILRTLLVTSAGVGEGASITAANLAITMAQELDRSIVIVDTNFRAPAQHTLFGLDRQPGLAEVLQGTAALEDALVYLPPLRLTLLPAGVAPPFPTELLASPGMRRVLDMLQAQFDRAVLDAPAVTPLADTTVMAPLVDGTLVVVRAGVTTRPALDHALAALTPHHVAGVVLNGAVARG